MAIDSEMKVTKIGSNLKFEIVIMNTPKKQYISPGEIRKINGVEVIAKEVFSEMDEKICPCVNCVILDQRICFSRVDKKSLPTRPACFGNDTENLSNKSLYYTKP